MQTEENALEIALELAAVEPGHRPEFLRLLLNSTVFILGSSGQPDGSGTLKTGTQIEIQNWVRPDGSSVIPFFTSLDALQLAIEGEEPYIALPARTFFAITLGAELVLNPRSEYGKEFTPDEVQALLSDAVSGLPDQELVETDRNILLGQPSNYPTAMVNSLAILLAKHSNVKAAYLALMHDPSADEQPHLIVGIEADGDVENVIREAGGVAGDTAPKGEPVDLIRVIHGESDLAQYFIEHVKPFYERK